MIKVVPTSEQVKTIQKYGLRFEDVHLGPEDGQIIVLDRWKLSENNRWFVIECTGEFEVRYKNPLDI